TMLRVNGARLRGRDRPIAPAVIATPTAIAAPTQVSSSRALVPRVTATTAAARTTGASTLEALRPSRCGNPRTPVRRSSPRSGNVLARCAPTPSNAVATISHTGTPARGNPASTTNSGSTPKATAYGSHDHAVAFTPALYAHPHATVTRCTSPATHPVASDNPTHSTPATRADHRNSPAVTRPATVGLSARPVTASRPASSQSLLQPTESCPVSTASVTSTIVRPEEPIPTAHAAASTVTRRAGAGWQARTSATAVPRQVRIAPPAVGQWVVVGRPFVSGCPVRLCVTRCHDGAVVGCGTCIARATASSNRPVPDHRPAADRRRLASGTARAPACGHGCAHASPRAATGGLRRQIGR